MGKAMYVLGLSATFACLGAWAGNLAGSTGAAAAAWWIGGAALGLWMGVTFAPFLQRRNRSGPGARI